MHSHQKRYKFYWSQVHILINLSKELKCLCSIYSILHTQHQLNVNQLASKDHIEDVEKILAVEKITTIQGSELQEVIENTNTGSTSQGQIAESINIDLGNIENSNENQENMAIVKANKAMSTTETSIKIYKSKTHVETISYPIHFWRWQIAIKEEI